MKLEELFLSVEQCRHLQELGLDMNDSQFCWVMPSVGCSESEWVISEVVPSLADNPWFSPFICCTYTLQEIIKKLPLAIVDEKKMVEYDLYIDFSDGYIGYANCPYDFGQLDLCDYEPHVDSLLANAYELLCWCIENKFIGKKK